jgi:hypothetical protein
VHWYFTLLRDCDFFEQLNEVLRNEVRAVKGRNPNPTIVVIDSQAVKTTEKGGHLDIRDTTTARR